VSAVQARCNRHRRRSGASTPPLPQGDHSAACSSTARAPRLARIVAVLAASCATAGAVPVAIAEPSQPAAIRYHDIEANKANSIRALGRHLAK